MDRLELIKRRLADNDEWSGAALLTGEIQWLIERVESLQEEVDEATEIIRRLNKGPELTEADMEWGREQVREIVETGR